MSPTRVVALGEELHVRGFALAAVEVLPAESPEEAVAAWRRLPEDAALLLLTPMARSALAGRLGERPRLLHAVVPTFLPAGEGGPARTES